MGPRGEDRPCDGDLTRPLREKTIFLQQGARPTLEGMPSLILLAPPLLDSRAAAIWAAEIRSTP